MVYSICRGFGRRVCLFYFVRQRDVRDRVRSRRCEMLAVVDRYTRILERERERERLAERLAPRHEVTRE